jgi:hypothetical protein
MGLANLSAVLALPSMFDFEMLTSGQQPTREHVDGDSHFAFSVYCQSEVESRSNETG